MTFLYRTGTFTSITTTGSQSVTGVGFQPKCLIVFSSGGTVEDVYNASALYSIGITDGTTSRVANSTMLNNSSGSVDRQNPAAIVNLSNGSGTGDLLTATLTSLDTDGFTVNWTTNSGAAARDCSYIALAGTDITNVQVGTFTEPGATGNFSVTGVGFKPDFLLFTTAGPGAGSGSLPTTGAELSIGFASSTTNRGAAGVASSTAATRQTFRYQRTNRCTLDADNLGIVRGEADLVSFDANGFTLNYITVQTLISSVVAYLAIKGGSYSVGSFNASTTTGTQAITGVGFAPSGILLASFDSTSQTTVQAENRLSIAAADKYTGSVAQRAISGHDKDNVSAGWSSRWDSKTHVFEAATTTSATASTHEMEATVSSFDSNGFTLNWGTNTGTLGAIEILYVAFGTSVAPVLNTRNIVPAFSYL